MEFIYPSCLTIDEPSGFIYICDYYNHRIQILSKEFSFESQFGKNTLEYPRDVKLSKEYIFVLDESNPCLHLFSYNHILQKSVISRGTGLQVIDPWYFFINQFNYMFISDHGAHSVLIFSPQFRLIHKISVSNSPMGVTLDPQGRLIVVSQADRDCLQIF